MSTRVSRRKRLSFDERFPRINNGSEKTKSKVFFSLMYSSCSSNSTCNYVAAMGISTHPSATAATHLNMCHSMIIEVRAGGESLATNLTLVWFLAGMYASMCVQWAGCTETFAAHQTDVGFFTCVIETKQYKNTLYTIYYCFTHFSRFLFFGN